MKRRSEFFYGMVFAEFLLKEEEDGLCNHVMLTNKMGFLN